MLRQMWRRFVTGGRGWMALLSFVGWVDTFFGGFEMCGLPPLPGFVHPAIDMGAVSRSRDARDADNEVGISFSVSVRSVNAGG